MTRTVAAGAECIGQFFLTEKNIAQVANTSYTACNYNNLVRQSLGQAPAPF